MKTVLHTLVSPLCDKSPGCNRKCFQLLNRRSYISVECYEAEQYTQDVHDVIAVGRGFTGAATRSASRLVRLENARKWGRNQVALEICRHGRGRYACCDCEHVDELEDEELGECAAKIRNTRCAVNLPVIIENKAEVLTSRA